MLLKVCYTSFIVVKEQIVELLKQPLGEIGLPADRQGV